MGSEMTKTPEAAPTTPDPIEIAMEAEASGTAPEGVAHEVLRRQSELFRWQIAGARAAFSLRVLMAVAGLGVAAVLAFMVWSASRADGLLIEAFETPPELQQQGFTGPVLAAQLQDKLTRMQRQTVARQAGATTRESAAADIRVQIPYAGISLGELDRLLRSSLGREIPVRGDLVRVASGPEAGALALTVRVGGDPGVRALATDGNVDALVQKAAEAVYEVRDPMRYLLWLRQQDRGVDARTAATRLAREASRATRAVAEYTLALDALTDTEVRAHLLRSVRLDPSFCTGWNDLGSREAYLARMEPALAFFRRALSCSRTDKTLSPAGRANTVALYAANVGSTRGDVQAAIAGYCVILGVKPCSPSAIAAAAESGALDSDVDSGFMLRLPVFTRAIARGHDLNNASRMMATRDRQVERRAAVEWRQAAAYVALGREDWLRVLAVAADGEANPPPRGQLRVAVAVIWRPYALARLGRREEALAAAAALPRNCYLCAISRAKTAALLGDRRGAEAWFAEAVRQGPSLPQARVEWGVDRLARGDAEGAIALARAAAQAVPGYPDAPQLWGEALLAQGDARGAAKKFAEAGKLAPNWGRNQLLWGEALAKLGKKDAALAQWRIAGGLDLTAEERARLNRNIAQAKA